MGKVKQWGMDQRDELAEGYALEGMDPEDAHERANREVFGPDYYHEPDDLG